jgi:hypothetical protein
MSRPFIKCENTVSMCEVAYILLTKSVIFEVAEDGDEGWIITLTGGY